MYGKILIKCKLTVETGMHIGSSNAFSAIGAVDSVVIRDSLTGQPIIPGSSIKGKMRTLLAKSLANAYILKDCSADPPEVCRLFGVGNATSPKTARLQFADAFMTNAQLLKQRGSLTEIKSENTISRLTSVANPRQIERVIRGSEFGLNLVYDLECDEDISEDFGNIAKALSLLSMDYLGGHGTRGYGRVSFSDFDVIVKDGECPADIDMLKNTLKEVEKYGIFNIQA